MKQDTLKKTLTAKLIVSIILTIGFPVGIALAVVGGTRMEEGALFKALLGIGIVGVVLGFYGAPISWIQYGQQKKYQRIILAVTEEGFRDINDVARHLAIKPEEALEAVNFCIIKRYLKGFTVDGTQIKQFYAPKADQKFSIQCPFCGGVTESDNPNEVKCEFCGRIITVDNNKDNK